MNSRVCFLAILLSVSPVCTVVGAPNISNPKFEIVPARAIRFEPIFLVASWKNDTASPIEACMLHAINHNGLEVIAKRSDGTDLGPVSFGSSGLYCKMLQPGELLEHRVELWLFENRFVETGIYTIDVRIPPIRVAERGRAVDPATGEYVRIQSDYEGGSWNLTFEVVPPTASADVEAEQILVKNRERFIAKYGRDPSDSRLLEISAAELALVRGSRLEERARFGVISKQAHSMSQPELDRLMKSSPQEPGSFRDAYWRRRTAINIGRGLLDLKRWDEARRFARLGMDGPKGEYRLDDYMGRSLLRDIDQLEIDAKAKAAAARP